MKILLDKVIYKLHVFLANSMKRSLVKRIRYVGKDVKLGDHTIIQNPEKVIIEDYTQISDFTVLLAGNNICIGKNCRISTCCMITSVSHKIASRNRISDDEVSNVTMNITISDNVWIGANCVVLPGTYIGNNSIIAAGSIVKGHVPDDEIWAGSPATFKSKIDFTR